MLSFYSKRRDSAPAVSVLDRDTKEGSPRLSKSQSNVAVDESNSSRSSWQQKGAGGDKKSTVAKKTPMHHECKWKD